MEKTTMSHVEEESHIIYCRQYEQ